MIKFNDTYIHQQALFCRHQSIVIPWFISSWSHPWPGDWPFETHSWLYYVQVNFIYICHGMMQNANVNILCLMGKLWLVNVLKKFDHVLSEPHYKVVFSLAENCWLSHKKLLQAAIDVLIIPIDQISEDHFTKGLWVQNWNLVPIPITLILTLTNCSCHNFSHVMRAQLSWYVQNYGMIRSPFTMPERQIFYKISVLSSWTIYEMGAWCLWLDSPEYETKWQHSTMGDIYGYTTARY